MSNIKKYILRSIIFFLFVFKLYSADIVFLDVKFPEKTSYPRFISGCINCHKKVTILDENHNFKCVQCHNGNNSSNLKKTAHKGIIPNPSDLKFVSEKCGDCHDQDIKKVKKSLMSTANGIINITRYLWGEQDSPLKHYSVYNLPNEKIVDDFLRKVCLRCHINTKGSGRFGESRSSGCAACHVPYKNNGEHLHVFSDKIQTAQCLHCHNFNRIGMDYAGYFEHDYSRTYRSPIYKGDLPPKIYGIYQHRLQEDVHFEKGMDCVDCHNKEDVMGNGDEKNFKYEQVHVKCESCHKKYNKKLLEHKLHKSLECYACHSAWGFQDYGLNVLREDFQGYFKWKFLKDINVPDTQEILAKSLGRYGELAKLKQGKKNFSDNLLPPYETDYLTGEKKLGVWYLGWVYRRWEDPVLGINQRGKISPVRPDYQFYVSYSDKDYNVKINNKKMIFNWSPYVPHTVSKYGRSCFSCHGNLKAMGLGYGMLADNGSVYNMFQPWKDGLKINFPLEKIVDSKGKPLQNFVYPEASPLSADKIKKCLKIK